MTDEKNTETLYKVLKTLATKKLDADFSDEINTLIEVYSQNFRHRYSQISNLVQILMEEDPLLGENLSQNLMKILNSGISDKVIFEKINKLSDHVNLEVGRFNLINDKIEKAIDKQNENLTELQHEKTNYKGLNDNLSKLNEKVYIIKQKYDLLDDKLEKNSISSITSLTIFSAVILAFSGSITFTSGVFNGMASVSSYRIIFICSLIGLIIFNLIFMLLFIVSRMAGKNICCRCHYYSEDGNHNRCENGRCSKRFHIPSRLCVLIHKYPYIVFVNSVICLLMYYDTILFFINNPHYISSIFPLWALNVFLWMPVILLFLCLCLNYLKKEFNCIVML